MWNAVFWGGVSGSAVLLGALAAILIPIKKNIIGYIMAFGTGVLIGAAAYELLADSVSDGGLWATAIGFITGAAVFTALDFLISKKGADKRKRSNNSSSKEAGLASNIPEGLSSTTGLLKSDYSKKKILLLWFSVLIISALSSMSGYLFLDHAPDYVLAAMAAFAGGGIIAMIASTMMPEAFEDGGPITGIFTAAGLLISLVLDSM
jgi:ZIP family zinc transporter